MTLAAELNPHKTELNPHKAIEATSRTEADQTSLPSLGQSRARTPPARQLARAELSHRPQSAVAMTLRYRHRPGLHARDAVMLGGLVVGLSVDRRTGTGDPRAPRSSLEC